MNEFSQLAFHNNRRALVMRSPGALGMETVVATPEKSGVKDRETITSWILWLMFLPAADGSPALPGGLQKENVQILLGQYPATSITIVSIVEGSAKKKLVEEIQTEERDFSEIIEYAVAVRVTREFSEDDDSRNMPVYQLNLRGLEEVDRFFTSAYFTFGEKSQEFLPAFQSNTAEKTVKPEIDYLNKDYDSFRSQMLDNLSLFVPTWKERHPADIGVTIVEVLAHAADYLSYYQDATGTEAYLDTARHRISVARHARLLAYRVNEGCNARAWVQVTVEPVDSEDSAGHRPESQKVVQLPVKTELLTDAGRFPGAIELDSQEYLSALQQGAVVFCTMEPKHLRLGYNCFEIYSWGSDEFVLKRGATSATLCGHWEYLRAGDVLLFEQIMSVEPHLGGPADPRKRCAVRLKFAGRPTYDSTNRPPEASGNSTQSSDLGTKITEIEWFDEDALPFDFPIAAVRQSQILKNLSVVRGNIVLADHGRVFVEELPEVQEGTLYRPKIRTKPISRCVTYRPKFESQRAATDTMRFTPRNALPSIYLIEHGSETAPVRDCPHGVHDLDRIPPGARWTARHDLLTSGPFARDFVVETHEDGTSELRFGDGIQGAAPIAGRKFTAVYRLGNGPDGNVGPNSIRHVVLTQDLRERLSIKKICLMGAKNHLAGLGGILRESTEHIRLTAPEMVEMPKSLSRCVIPEDYVMIAKRHPLISEAVAEEVWTGTWSTMAVYLRRLDSLPIDPRFEAEMQDFFRPYLLAGRNVIIRSPKWVPLEIRLKVWVAVDSARSLTAAAAAVVDSTALKDLSGLAVFGFGKAVILSDILSRVAAIPSVDRVEALTFKRYGQPPRGELEAGEIPIGNTEIAQLSNEYDQPQKGLLAIQAEWVNPLRGRE